MWKNVIIIFLIFGSNLIYSYPTSTGNQGAVRIKFSASTFYTTPLYGVSLSYYPWAFLDIAVTASSPIPSWCVTPTIQLLGNDLRAVEANGNRYFNLANFWRMWDGSNWWDLYNANTASLSNGSTFHILSWVRLPSANYSYTHITTNGLIVIYGNGCSGANFRVNGSLTINHYYSSNISTDDWGNSPVGWKTQNNVTFSIPLTFHTSNF